MSTLDLSVSRTDRARFWSKVQARGECLIWTGTTRAGYGQIHLAGRNRSAHRVSLWMAGREIPAGLVVDHICRTPGCVRPAHLRVVTQRENVLSGRTIPAEELARDVCRNGHPLVEGNVRLTRQGWRDCRACCRARWHRIQGRRAAADALAREWSPA